ncbi:MAG TPA: DNA polymerase III subunit beta, partial [Candidatus Andersenbacteria bacterium]|nr:DNA polymerase III subunit beta [Candidatus Andersenbacteria bacterium]
LEIKNKNLFISLRGFKAQFPTAPADDFPLLPVAPSDTLAVVDGHRLGQALDNTIFAAARDESRPEIHSLYLHGETDVLRLAATDSFRLAESIVPLREGNKPFSFLLPISAAQEVRRLFGQRDIVTVLATDNYVVFRDQGLYLSSRLVEGTYPDYRQIIPTAFDCRGEVKREELLRALKILSVFLPRDSRRISLRVQGEQGVVEMRTEGREAGQGEVTMAWQGKGKDVEVFFNITYLLDGATHGRSERVELGFGGSSSPVMFRPVEEAAKNLYIVMPIQV